MIAHTFEPAALELDDDLALALDESDRLQVQLEHMAAANHNLSELLLNIDAQNDKLLKLLVAMRSLVESSSGAVALRRLQDILVTVIGSAEFLIYSVDNTIGSLVPIAGAGAAFDDDAAVSLHESTLGGMVRMGEVVVTPEHPHLAHRDDFSAAAVVPLKVLDRVVGAIVINRLIPQRKSLGECDRDVLGLLGAYAASAIITADQRPEWNQLPVLRR